MGDRDKKVFNAIFSLYRRLRGNILHSCTFEKEKKMKLNMNYKQAVLISLPFFAITMFWQAYDTIMPQILAYHYGISKTLLGVLMGVDNLIALLFLPLFGALSDKMNSRFGRRTPFVFLGTIGGAISFLMLAAADNMQLAKLNVAQIPQQYAAAATEIEKAAVLEKVSNLMSGDYSSLILLLAALLVGVFIMSVFRAPAVALTADTFVRPQRSAANAVLTILGGVAGVVFLVMNKGMASLFGGYGKLMILSAVTMVIAILVYVIFVKENKLVEQMQKKSRELGLADENNTPSGAPLPKEKRISFIFIMAVVILMYMGYNGYSTHFSVYAIDYLKLTPSSLSGPLLVRVIAVLVFSIPAAALSTKIGRNSCARIGLAIAGCALFVTYFLNETNVQYLSVIFIFFAFGFALVSVNVGPMMMELCSDGDVGKYAGYYYVGTAVAQIITPAFAGFFADTFTYQVLPIYGMAFMFLGVIATYFIKHGDSKVVDVSVLDALAAD